jgi:hypothetical protein
VEGAFLVRWHRRAGHVSSRPAAERFDARLACPDSGRHPEKASRWIDALELPQPHLGVSKDVVHRVWKEAGLKPHRIERYLASDDPDFEIESRRHHRSVPESAAARGRVLRG